VTTGVLMSSETVGALDPSVMSNVPSSISLRAESTSRL
jgi:hypothetical protein